MASEQLSWLRVREQDLVEKTAIVTGGSQGIGRAICLNLASRGCSILATCSTPASLHLIDTLDDTVRELYNGHLVQAPKVFGVPANILESDCATTIANAAVKYLGGQVNIFVNNAGITGSSHLGSLDAAHIQSFTIGNIQTPTMIINELVKRKLFRKDSRIIYVSSERSKVTSATSSMYSASKAAGEALVRSWADAFGGKVVEYDFMSGTTANTVLVGLTKTEAMKRHPPETVERLAALHVGQQSLPRAAEPEDVADAVGMLCSGEARWVTGAVVATNGGGYKIG